MKKSRRVKIYLLGLLLVAIGMNALIRSTEIIDLIKVLNSIAVYYCESKCFFM